MEGSGECNNVSQGDFAEKELEMALDSGAVSHVCSDDHTAGYLLQPTAASRPCASFIVGYFATIPNQGMKHVNLAGMEEQDGAVREGDLFQFVFQVARVTRPLMSVSQICDNGHTVVFDKAKGVVRDNKDRVVCVFKRVGGLYLGKLRLKSPFARHA